jgi:hypothetical protein
MRQELARTRFGQPHQVFNFQVVVQFGAFLGGQRCGFLALKEVPDALTGWFRRPEFNQLTRSE